MLAAYKLCRGRVHPVLAPPHPMAGVHNLDVQVERSLRPKWLDEQARERCTAPLTTPGLMECLALLHTDLQRPESTFVRAMGLNWTLVDIGSSEKFEMKRKENTS